jgi:hypothetical protein
MSDLPEVRAVIDLSMVVAEPDVPAEPDAKEDEDE